MKSQGMTKVRTSNPEETLQKLVVNHSARGKKTLHTAAACSTYF